jgi:hypothetical protein
VHLSDQGRLVAGTRDRPGPKLPWLGNEGRLKSIKNWLHTYQGIDPDRLVNKEEEQTQTQAPIIQTDFTALYNREAPKDSDWEISTNWEDDYEVIPMDESSDPWTRS